MSKNSKDLSNSAYAFIFLSNKSRAQIAPFEAILCELAKKHNLDFASTFLPNQHSTKPNELYFFVREKTIFPENTIKSRTKSSTDSANEPPQNQIISFANAISENLPLSMDFVFSEIKNENELKNTTQNTVPKKFNNTPPKNTKSIPTVLQTKALLQAFENALKATSKSAKSSNSTESSQNSIKDIPHIDSLDSVLKPFFMDINFDNNKCTKPKKQGDKKSSKSSKSSTSSTSSTSSELILLISKLSQNLAQGKSIQIHTTRGEMELSTQKPTTLQNPPFVMFFELGAVQSYMRVNQAQISLLGSFEKPSMKLCPKEVFAKEFFAANDKASNAKIKCVEIECLLAFEPFLALLGVNARMLGIDFVFAKTINKSSPKSPSLKSNKSKIPKSNNTLSTQECLDSAIKYTLTYTTSAHKRIACNKDGIYIEDKRTKLNLFSLIRKHYEPLYVDYHNASKTLTSKDIFASQMLVIYLSKSKNSAIWIYSQMPPQNAKDNAQQKHIKDTFNEVLHIDFSLNPALILEQISRYENGKKLIDNFKSHFGENALDFSHCSTLSNSQNLIAFFANIAKVLGYCDAKSSVKQGIESVLNNAKLFLRDKGPRIDYKSVKTAQNKLTLDMPKILQSAMSFALAGVDNATLCYGIVDSLCEFMGGLARDMEQNYGIKKIFLCGDMLTESIFLDKITHYIPKNLELILPQDGFVDTL